MTHPARSGDRSIPVAKTLGPGLGVSPRASQPKSVGWIVTMWLSSIDGSHPEKRTIPEWPNRTSPHQVSQARPVALKDPARSEPCRGR